MEGDRRLTDVMEVAYRLKCPDPRTIMDLPDEVLDCWIWFFNQRTERIEDVCMGLEATGGATCPLPAFIQFLD